MRQGRQSRQQIVRYFSFFSFCSSLFSDIWINSIYRTLLQGKNNLWLKHWTKKVSEQSELPKKCLTCASRAVFLGKRAHPFFSMTMKGRQTSDIVSLWVLWCLDSRENSTYLLLPQIVCSVPSNTRLLGLGEGVDGQSLKALWWSTLWGFFFSPWAPFSLTLPQQQKINTQAPLSLYITSYRHPQESKHMPCMLLLCSLFWQWWNTTEEVSKEVSKDGVIS